MRSKRGSPNRGDIAMSLMAAGIIEIPNSLGSSFDHGALDPETRRVFIAHTARDSLEVVDADANQHVATLRGFPGAAGVVADKGSVLVTNRGSASLAWVGRAHTGNTDSSGYRAATERRCDRFIFAGRSRRLHRGRRPHRPQLQVLGLGGDRRWSSDLPGRPRWCVVDAKEQRVFLAIRDPSMVLVARLPELNAVQHWPLPSGGAHGMDVNHEANLLYVACDGGLLVEVDVQSGEVRREWPLAGGPDATFFNPESGLVHVAIENPGLVQTVDPRTGASTQFITAVGAKTTALIEPDRLYVFSPMVSNVMLSAVQL
jgi:hypothetical protein